MGGMRQKRRIKPYPANKAWFIWFWVNDLEAYIANIEQSLVSITEPFWNGTRDSVPNGLAEHVVKCVRLPHNCVDFHLKKLWNESLRFIRIEHHLSQQIFDIRECSIWLSNYHQIGKLFGILFSGVFAWHGWKKKEGISTFTNLLLNGSQTRVCEDLNSWEVYINTNVCFA